MSWCSGRTRSCPATARIASVLIFVCKTRSAGRRSPSRPLQEMKMSSSDRDVVVLGSYTLLPSNGENRIRLDIRLQDTIRGETIAEQAITGNENELFRSGCRGSRVVHALAQQRRESHPS